MQLQKRHSRGYHQQRPQEPPFFAELLGAIIRNELTDPRFYEELSKLPADLIKQNRDDAASYVKFLLQAEALVKRLAGKQPDAGIPAALHGKPEAIVLFNNLLSIPATTFQYPTDDEERARLHWNWTRSSVRMRRQTGRAMRRGKSG